MYRYVSFAALFSHVSHKHALLLHCDNQIKTNASASVDIHAFTCRCACGRVVLFIMLTGVPPFQRPVKGLRGHVQTTCHESTYPICRYSPLMWIDRTVHKHTWPAVC